MNYERLKQIIEGAKTEKEVFEAIVNAPFEFKVEVAHLFLGIIVLLQVNKQTGMIDRVALSNTELAKNTTNVSSVPFKAIKIPIMHSDNIISKAIATGEPQDTIDWKFLFTPALTPEQARINQASGGIAYSCVYPLKVGDGGAMIFSYFQYADSIDHTQQHFMETYVSVVTKCLKWSKSRERS